MEKESQKSKLDASILDLKVVYGERQSNFDSNKGKCLTSCKSLSVAVDEKIRECAAELAENKGIVSVFLDTVMNLFSSSKKAHETSRGVVSSLSEAKAGIYAFANENTNTMNNSNDGKESLVNVFDEAKKLSTNNFNESNIDLESKIKEGMR